MDVFWSQMSAHGYQGQSVVTDSSEFGLPARRRRLYIFLVRVDGNPLLSFQDRNPQSIFATFCGLLSGCVRPGPCASEILLPDHDEAVRKELTLRQQRRAEQNQVDKNTSGDWADQHMKLAASMRVRWGTGAPPELAQNPWFETLTVREKDALPLLRSQVPLTLMRDLSQSILRANAATWRADSKKHQAPTILPRMNVWLEPVGHLKQGRMLLGREALLYQGFPVLLFLETLDDLQQQAKASEKAMAAGQVQVQVAAQPVLKADKKRKAGATEKPAPVPRQRDLLLTWQPSEALMQDLAGNAMALPVVLTMLQCAFASVCWREKGMNAAAAPVSTQKALQGQKPMDQRPIVAGQDHTYNIF